MAIYKHPSWIYFNDTELFELLSNLGHRELLKVARQRGFIFSEKADDAFVRSALSLLPSNWPLIGHVYALITKPDPAERQSVAHVHNCSPDNDVAAIAGAVRDERSKKNAEDFVITQADPGSVRIIVTYVDTDLTKALQYSRRERTLEIEAVKEGETITFHHDATDRARAIVKQIENQIKPIQEKSIREEVISLKTVRDPVLRTMFFTEMLKEVDGHIFVSTSHAVVERRMPEDAPEEQEDGDDEEVLDEKQTKKAAEKVKGTINRLAFSGDQVLAASLYQQAAETGYFITQLNWTVESKSEPGKFVDFVAGFGDPITCDQFSSDVSKRWQWSIDNPDKAETLLLLPHERRSLNALIQASADKAFTKVRAAREEKPKKPEV